MEYATVAEAIDAPGLRLVLTAGVPGPWGEAAKAILDYKGLDYLPVFQEGGGENAELRQWTGQTSAPVAVYDKLPPVCHWLDLLMLAERLAPEKPLVPAEPARRVEVIGLSALIAGVDGFGWNRRLHMLAPMMALEDPPLMVLDLANKYGWSEEAHAAATPRLQAICAELDGHLADGRDYFTGDTVSAADFYWASFANMIRPLPAEVNPMPDYMRATYESGGEEVQACFTDRLEAHRDRMYDRHVILPLDF